MNRLLGLLTRRDVDLTLLGRVINSDPTLCGHILSAANSAFFNRAGCVARSRQTVVTRPPVFGWSFDSRIHSGTARTLGGKRVNLMVRHFGGRIDATFFLVSNRFSLLRNVVLRDAAGHVIVRIRR